MTGIIIIIIIILHTGIIGASDLFPLQVSNPLFKLRIHVHRSLGQKFLTSQVTLNRSQVAFNRCQVTF